jgi:hypothetical protein
VAGGADPSQPAGALVQGLHWRHRSRGLSAPSESSVGSDSDSGADGIPGSRVAGYSHPWPKRIRLAEPETNSPSDQSTPPGGARSSPAPAVGGPAYGFMVGNMFHGRPPRPTRRRRRWSAHLRAARRSRSQKASPAPQGQCSEDLHDSLFGRNLGDGDGPHVPLVGVDPMILEAAAAPIAVRQRPAGARGPCHPCPLLIALDPAVACLTAMPYDLPPLPPTRPTLFERDMACSRFGGSSTEPALVTIGAEPQDRWDPMEQVESILPALALPPDWPTRPSEAQLGWRRAFKFKRCTISHQRLHTSRPPLHCLRTRWLIGAASSMASSWRAHVRPPPPRLWTDGLPRRRVAA